MSRLIVLPPDDEVARRSSELRFATELCLESARAVYEQVERLADAAAVGAALASDMDADLLLLERPVYLGAASIAAMRDAAAGPTERTADGRVVVPIPFHVAAGEAAGAVETLADYRELERRLVLQSGTASGEADAPAALLVTAAARLAEPGATTRRDVVTRLVSARPPVRAGLVFEFTDYYGGAREDVLPYLPERIDHALVVGCGRGASGAMLAQRFGCRVTGVEVFEPAAREAARRLDVVHAEDVASAPLAGPFDVVLMLDVLEHLEDPSRVLRRVRELLAEDGRLVLSVPNVGCASVVRDLVRGRWDYVPMGLLCWTHLRFFTRATLVEMLARAGFSRVEVEGVGGAIPADATYLLADPAADRESLATREWMVVARR